MIEWQQPGILRSVTLGDLLFNQPTTVDGNQCMFLLDPGRCKATRGMRATVDNVPQADGEIFHRRFSNGVEFAMVMEFWQDTDTAACDEVARLMQEALAKWLESMKNEAGRYLWSPTDYADDRMMDEARWLVPIDESLSGDGIWEVTFTIDTPFPYVIDSTEQTFTAADGVPEVVTNAGNVEHFPVLIADGPFSNLTIENQTSGLTIVYDSSRPGGQAVGGGDIAEIDTFRNTIYLGIGGIPGDDDNLKPNIDPLQTDYFTLLPGANTILATGTDVDLLVNNAWHP